MVLAFYVKLGALLVKQVSKPLATQLKSTAMQHPAMQRYLIRFGQRMHEFNSSLSQKLKSEGELAGRKVFVTKLDDDAALKKAADFMGEVFIFSVAGLAVVYEVRINSKKDELKSRAAAEERGRRDRELAEVREAIKELFSVLQNLEERVAAAERAKARSAWWPRAARLDYEATPSPSPCLAEAERAVGKLLYHVHS